MPRNFNTAALANNPLEPNPFVLAASSFPVFGGAKYLLAEKPVFFGFEGPVVDRFWFLYFAVGPGSDGVRCSEANPDIGELIDINHLPLSIRNGDGRCVSVVTVVASEARLLRPSLARVG